MCHARIHTSLFSSSQATCGDVLSGTKRARLAVLRQIVPCAASSNPVRVTRRMRAAGSSRVPAMAAPIGRISFVLPCRWLRFSRRLRLNEARFSSTEVAAAAALGQRQIPNATEEEATSAGKRGASCAPTRHPRPVTGDPLSSSPDHPELNGLGERRPGKCISCRWGRGGRTDLQFPPHVSTAITGSLSCCRCGFFKSAGGPVSLTGTARRISFILINKT